jgi:hypothetical protein
LSEDVWDGLWSDWQERRTAIRQKIALLGQTKEIVIANLDDALQIFTQLSQLYGKLSSDEQQALLSLLVEKVIVDSTGMILRLELHPPSAYLANKYDALKKRLSNLSKNATHDVGGVSEEQCSEYIRVSWETWTRTKNDGTRIRSFAIKLSPNG